MEPNESSGGLGSYYHHPHQPPPPPPHHHQQPNPNPTSNNTSPPTNGILPSTTTTTTTDGVVSLMPMPSYSQSVDDTLRKKRGRPRKYHTPEQAAAARRLASSTHLKKKDHASREGPASYPKTLLANLAGTVPQSFTPHIIFVAPGEDVGQKIMLFMQQSKHEICILSASGSISNVSLRQPATSGGNITYEGRFDIVSLSGSYVRTEFGGKTGGLSVCLSCTDGQIIGGGVGGPLMAAGPVQVIVSTFLINTKKDIAVGVKGDNSASDTFIFN